MRNYFLFFLWMLAACTGSRQLTAPIAVDQSVSSLKLLDEYRIPFDQQYQDSWVGGLSGIDYDSVQQTYYIISDERSATTAARYYKADIQIRDYQIDTILWLDKIVLRNADQDSFPSLKSDPQHAADPESIRYHQPSGTLVWSSEGDKALRGKQQVLQDPWIFKMKKNGHFISRFQLPEHLKMHQQESGARVNAALEGLSFSKDFRYLWASMEGPLYEDGPLASPDYANAPVRFTQFDWQTQEPVAQYVYPLDAVTHPPVPAGSFNVNGVSEQLCLGANRFIVMERSFSTGIEGCEIRLYLADFSRATDVLKLASLQKTAYQPASKRLLLNLSEQLPFVDNVEGISWGPRLPNGHQSLLLIADNNFNVKEIQQVFLLEVLP